MTQVAEAGLDAALEQHRRELTAHCPLFGVPAHLPE
jgi:hypothetical protein